MKKAVILIILGLFLVGSGWAVESRRSLFDSANRLYEQGDFSGALRLYQQLENRVASWKLSYNIGNCHFKLNDFVKAKIYYLRAKKSKPLHPSIEKNIRIVNSRFKDRIPGKKIDFINRLWLKIESSIPIDVVSGLLALFLFLLNGSIFLWMKQGTRKPVIYGFMLSLVLSVLTASYHIYRVDKSSTRNTAVVVRIDAQLRSGPGGDNTVLFSVHPGLTVRIIERSGEWFQVSASSDIAGWINHEYVEII